MKLLAGDRTAVNPEAFATAWIAERRRAEHKEALTDWWVVGILVSGAEIEILGPFERDSDAAAALRSIFDPDG